ncbi:MAG: helix-turn-helix domain-containing protein [Thalassovita sp.]
MDLMLVDVALRGASTGIFALFIVLVWLGRVARDAQISFTIVAIAISARVWSTMAPGVHLDPTALQVLRIIGAWAGFGGTWFILTIFLEDRRHTWVWLLSGGGVAMGITIAMVYPDVVPFLRGYALLHFVALTTLILLSARGDLLDARRRIRPAVAAVLLLFAMSGTLTSVILNGEVSTLSALSKSLLLLLCLSLLALWSLKVNVANWPGIVTPRPETEPSRELKNAAQIALIKRIEAAMASGIWRNEGLTISALAQTVDAPEHQVRRAINQGLGYRNFSRFINQSRIKAAQDSLTSLEDSGKTVLEIAYSVGFSSLGPFNRAFREATGLSPSEYRQKIFAVNIADSKIS